MKDMKADIGTFYCAICHKKIIDVGMEFKFAKKTKSIFTDKLRFIKLYICLDCATLVEARRKVEMTKK